MSTYLDTRSGRWFNSKAELLAYQRGEEKTSPRSVSKPEVKQSEPVEEKQEPAPQEETEDADTPVEEPQEEKPTKQEIFDPQLEAMVREAMLKSVDEMKDELKNRFGIDGRTLRFSNEDEVTQMYLDRVKAAWKAKYGKE
jgi:hypothetical protein